MTAIAPGFPARFVDAQLIFSAPQSERWGAFDTWRQAPVNLIRGMSADEASVARMVRAYRFLAMADSPHLPVALAWGRLPDGAGWAAMTPLTEQPEPSGPAEEAVVREWAIAGARALVEARRYGVLHRFISPTAFKRGPDGQLVLSMWAVNGRVGEPDGLVTGVMPYLAPEALAGAPTTASDFYALGATLYAVATGRPPHDSLESAALAAARRTSPPSLRTARPDLSEAIATTVDRLLARDPADRLADGLAMLAALGAPLLPSLSSPPVDHEAPLERLVKAYESFLQRSGGAIVVTGAAGAGKSTVIRQFELEVALRGGLVALTRPSADEDRLSAVERWLVTRGLAADAVAAERPPAAELPAAARAMVHQAALAHRVAEACARSRVVLVLEDLSLDEEETLLRLERLLARHGSHVMVVATVSRNGDDGARVLARLKRNPLVRELPLGPLSEAAGVAMASYALGPDAPSLPAVKDAIGASGGHPLMLIETFRAMVADGQLAREPGGWVAVTPGRHLPLAPSLDAVLTARAAALGPAAWRLGAAVALLGEGEATRAMMAIALDWPPGDTWAPALQALESERWLTREGTAYRLAHSLLRPVLLQALDGAEQRALHARVARALEGLGAGPDAIARHWELSGEVDRAADWYGRAAVAAEARGAGLDAFRRRQSAFRLVTDPARRATLAAALLPVGAGIDPAFGLELAASALTHPPEDPVALAMIGVLRASCLSTLGRYGEALAQLDQGRRPEAPAWVEGLIGAYRGLILMQQGLIGRARVAAADAARRLPADAGPDWPSAWGWALRLGRFGVGLVGSAFGSALGLPDDCEALEALAAGAEATGLPHMPTWPWLYMAQSAALEGRLAVARRALSRARTAMDQAGASPLAETRAMAVEAFIAARAGELDQALRSGGAAVAYARAHTPHPPFMALALVAHAEALLTAGRMSEAETAAADALRMAQPEAHALTAHARFLLATAMGRRQPRESVRLLEATLAEVRSDETPNRLLAARAWRQLGESRLALDEPAEAIEALTHALEEAERHDWPFVRVTAMITIARYHKARRHYARMQRMLRAAVQLAQAGGYMELVRQARQLSRFGVNGFTPRADLQRLLEHPGPTPDLVAQGLSLARGLARTDRAALYLWEHDEPQLAGAFPEGVDPLLSGHDLLKQVLRSGETHQRHGVTGVAGRGWLVDAEVRSLLAMPLAGPHGPLGVLYMDRRADQAPFTRGEVARLEALAAYLALSLDRAQLRSLAGAARDTGHAERLEAALSDMLEAEQAKRGYLSIVSADLRHQLGQLRAAIATRSDDAGAQSALLEAVEHAERLAEVLEKGIRE